MGTTTLGGEGFKVETARPKNLAIVDSKVDNYEQLVRGVKHDTEVILLEIDSGINRANHRNFGQ